MAKITTIVGDATKPKREGEKPIVIAHCCNDIPAWGSGFVNAVTDRWGEGPRQAYLSWGSDPKTRPALYDEVQTEYNVAIATWQLDFGLGKAQILRLPNNIYIANMVGQHGVKGQDASRPPIRYLALIDAMQFVKTFIQTVLFDHDDVEIHCPKFGSDLAGGNWDFIHEIIKEVWVDKGISVTVYEWGG